MKTIKIALLGFGTVGQGVWNLIEQNREQIASAHDLDIKIEKILVPNLEKDRGIEAAKALFTTNFSEIENDKSIDIVVELIGKGKDVLDYLKRSLKAGKHVVSANKHIVAREGLELSKLADEANKFIKFEASVCGAIPIVDLITKSLSANQIDKIMGIMNGTSNYILSSMDKDGVSYEEALKEAQRLGYAESDPTDDVEGYDAANKIAILASIAFNSFFDINKVYTEGIDKITREDFEKAREMDATIKLIASAEKTTDGVEISVKPCFVKKSHPLASIDEAFNAVTVETNCAGDINISGKGAGSLPTASAVVADIIDIAIKNDSEIDYSYAYRMKSAMEQKDASKMTKSNDFEAIG